MCFSLCIWQAWGAGYPSSRVYNKYFQQVKGGCSSQRWVIAASAGPAASRSPLHPSPSHRRTDPLSPCSAEHLPWTLILFLSCFRRLHMQQQTRNTWKQKEHIALNKCWCMKRWGYFSRLHRLQEQGDAGRPEEKLQSYNNINKHRQTSKLYHHNGSIP